MSSMYYFYLVVSADYLLLLANSYLTSYFKLTEKFITLSSFVTVYPLL